MKVEKNPHQNEDDVQAKARELVDAIFKESYAKLVQYAVLALSGSARGDVGRAEDIVQDAMVIAIKNAENFCNSDNPTGWLILTIRNTAKNVIRSDKRLETLVTEYAYVSDTVVNDSHSVEFSFSGIVPDDDFKLLRMCYVEGYTYRDLQRQLGISTSTLSMRLIRAKSKFIKNYFLDSGKSDTPEHNKTGGVANEQS